MKAAGIIDRGSRDEERTWFAALALGAFAFHAYLFAKYRPQDALLFVGAWYEHILDAGPIGAFAEPFGNYTPPYLYLLSATTLFDGLAPVEYLIKSLSWAGALWLVLAGRRLCAAVGKPKYLAFALLFLPSVIANVSMLGQADTFWVAPCVLAIAAAVERRFLWVAMWSGLAFAFKAQAVFFAPFVLHLFIANRVPFVFWCLAPLIYVIAMIPAWIVGWPAWDLATIYVAQANWQPPGHTFISNSASVWTLFGYLSPKVAWEFRWLGLLAAAATIVAYLRFMPRHSGAKLIAAAALSAASLPFVLPGMHERFFILADVLAFLYAVVAPSRRSIAAALTMQIASAGPVFFWAFYLEPLELIAPLFVEVAIYLLIMELLDSHNTHRIGEALLVSPHNPKTGCDGVSSSSEYRQSTG